MAGRKGMKHLSYTDRLKIEALLNEKHGVSDIARRIGVHRSTIYDEIKRGQYEHLLSDLRSEMRYSADLGQMRYEEGQKERGTQLKIGHDIEYANYLEKRILENNMSPEAVLGELKTNGEEKKFKTRICVRTLYNYIEKGIFLSLTNKDLPVKGKKKRKYKKIKRQKRANAGTSIEKRPAEVDTRENFGDWEMDSVIGRRGSKNALVVLTERKTRYEMIFKANDHSADEVVAIIDRLEKEWGDMFSKVFRTITVDNGSEFAYAERLETSPAGGERTKVYYCHAYHSWERGSNENQNRMIRRRIPKGSKIDDIPGEEISSVEHWMNNYPRRIHNYRTARQLFEKEIQILKATA